MVHWIFGMFIVQLKKWPAMALHYHRISFLYTLYQQATSSDWCDCSISFCLSLCLCIVNYAYMYTSQFETNVLLTPECLKCTSVSFQRAGTVDSVMSNRPFSRPNTSNTLVLPRSVSFCMGYIYAPKRTAFLYTICHNKCTMKIMVRTILFSFFLSLSLSFFLLMS